MNGINPVKMFDTVLQINVQKDPDRGFFPNRRETLPSRPNNEKLLTCQT